MIMKTVIGGSATIQGQPVTLDSFQMAETPITQELYEKIRGKYKNPSNVKGGDLPVENVDFLDAVMFCNSLSKRDNLTPCYVTSESNVWIDCDWTADGYRLPTEAEWEYAANGGIHNSGCTYSGSNNINDVAWYNGNSNGTTHPVAQKNPNALGLYDMSGNVWEWCWDYFSNAFNGGNNPKGPSKASPYHVIRGGSLDASDSDCTVLARNCEHHRKGNESGIFKIVGFRVVRSAGNLVG